jgi:hypothetical protein
MAAGGLMCTSLAIGCAKSGPSKPSDAKVDPATVAAAAVELCDANNDASIDAEEAAGKCPPLAAAFAAFDADGDGKLTAKEITDQVTAVFRTGGALTGISVSISWNGRPLSGASVKMRPVAFFADSILSAEGSTDEHGVANPKIGDEHLPSDYAGETLLYPGLYHVEITHPEIQLPVRYNSATELGFEVNPTARDGTSVQFDLKSN